MRGKKKTKKTRANDRILHLTYGISLSYWILYILYNKRRLLSLFNSLIHSVLLTRYRFKSVSNLHIYNDLACRIIHPPRLGSAAKHGGGSIALSVKLSFFLASLNNAFLTRSLTFGGRPPTLLRGLLKVRDYFCCNQTLIDPLPEHRPSSDSVLMFTSLLYLGMLQILGPSRIYPDVHTDQLCGS